MANRMDEGSAHTHDLRVHYEDTDHTGVVFHPNYLRYFERAREDLVGIDELVRLLDEGIGFVVYRAEMTIRDSAEFGDPLQVQTRAERANDYRLVFRQKLYRRRDSRLLVRALVELACVNQDRQLVPLPDDVVQRLIDKA